MDFELTAEQAMLRAASRDMLADRTTVDRARVDHGADPFDEGLWRLGCELGWTGLAVPEAHGGTEQGLTELALVAEELGRAAAPGPFVPTALVARALAGWAGEPLRAEVLPALADGLAAAALATVEPGRSARPDDIATVAVPTAGGHVLTGCKTAVQDAGHARWILVTALVANRPALVLVDAGAPGVHLRRQETLDPTRAFFEVRLDRVEVGAGRLLDGGQEAVQLLLDAGSILTAADALGAMERMLAMTVEHVSARRQFGRVIGSFQAVKQGCASMAVDVHATRAATLHAAMSADAGTPDAARAACAAASFTGAAARRVAGQALQLHGGIGFTWEHDLHLYQRRATVDAALGGDPAVHDERLCALLAPTA